MRRGRCSLGRMLAVYNAILIPIAGASIYVAVLGASAADLYVLAAGVGLTVASPYLALPPAIKILRRYCRWT